MNTVVIKQSDALYPSALREVFKKDAPETITAIGNPDLLKENKLAIFCSNKCPGALILKTYDLLRQLKESSETVISGFHSTIEQECLNILLKRRQNIIICPARSIEGMKIKDRYQKPIEEGSLLFLSPFDIKHNRISAQRSEFRNQFVAAIADKILVPHAAPDSKTEKLCIEVINKGKTVVTFKSDFNNNLIKLGAETLE